ncbi:hypothetical protein HCH_05610 [Hahella chejuensis KCTC 2396]|uniref:Uncharacterized protein n=2 Tax=Hahella chejuensis TaxID=158327 RepID=Q2SAQ6_HAHCH|nr:hypothetical protein HCH_05610 [Hahella chejuensis KCTC 2396]
MNADGSARTIGINDNSAFKFAALNVEKTYQKFGDSVILKKITTAQDIVNFISSLQTSSIASLDILCHGSPLTLNFSLKPYEACGFYASWLGKKAIESYYSDDDGSYSFTSQARSVSDINWSKFTDNARVQLHGCLTASDWFRAPNGKKIFPILVDNIVEQISDELQSAGKSKALVIGHTTRGNPLINGKNTTLLQQDYRHGERKIYSNGKLVLTTKQKGYLDESF